MSAPRSAQLVAANLLPPVPEPLPWFRVVYKTFYKERWGSCKALTTRLHKYTVSNTPTANSVTIHFVRHGEGIHNVLAAKHQAKNGAAARPPYSMDNIDCLPDMIDAPLTLLGIQQAKENAVQTPFLSPQPDYLVSSPLQRALVTGLVSFNFARPANTTGKVVVHEGARESFHSNNICDLRRNTAEIKQDFPFVDFSNIIDDEPDVKYVGIDGENTDSVVDRMYDFMEWLWEDMERSGSKCVGVASHSVALFALTNGVLHFEEGAEDGQSSMYGTGELRTYYIERT